MMKKKEQSRIIPVLTIIIGILLIALAIFFRSSSSRNSPAVTPTLLQSSQDVARISLEDAKAAYDSGDAFFLDVRDRETYNYAHIPGAVNIPASELDTRLDEVPQDKLIILY